LTIRPQLAAILQKYSFASARVLAQHFLTSVPTIEEILQRELELKKFSRRWVPHFLFSTQKIADSKVYPRENPRLEVPREFLCRCLTIV
jgi:hypothetical protein